MADYTPNYNLKKPASTDFVDIEDLNGNADIIDETLAAKADLDEDGKVPTSQLPSQGNYIPTSEKGAANGVATLDSNGDVPITQLPTDAFVGADEKGAANGVATLDDTGKVPSTQVPGYDTTESHIADTTKHVTAEDKETWNGLDDFVRIAVPTTGWVTNEDTATADMYPMINTVAISACLYAHPIWAIAGSTDSALPTAEETDAFNVVPLMFAQSNQLIFYTTESEAPTTFYVYVQGVSV